GDRGDEALGGQLSVGPGSGDDADPQVTRQSADGRQSAALRELARQDGRPHLLFDLLVERHASTVGQHHPHDSPPASPFLQLYIGTIYRRNDSVTRYRLPTPGSAARSSRDQRIPGRVRPSDDGPAHCPPPGHDPLDAVTIG